SRTTSAASTNSTWTVTAIRRRCSAVANPSCASETGAAGGGGWGAGGARGARAASWRVRGAAAATAVARAQWCGRPDLVDMVPPDMATGVPLNARLGAHYATSAEYLGEDVVLVHPPDGGQEVLRECAPNMTKPCATWSRAEQFLQVTPTEPLQPNSSYEIRWPALRGLNAAAPGVGGRAMFETGGTDDVAAPVFDGVTG